MNAGLLYLVRPSIGSELMKGRKEHTGSIFRSTGGGYLRQDSYVAAVIWHEIEHTNHPESLVPLHDHIGATGPGEVKGSSEARNNSNRLPIPGHRGPH